RRKARIAERVPDGKERIAVIVKEHIHLGHCEGDGVQFLPVKLRRGALLCRVTLLKDQPRLDEQSGRTARWIIDRLVRRRVEQFGHQPADFFRRVKLSGALPLAFGELTQQVFISAAKYV